MYKWILSVVLSLVSFVVISQIPSSKGRFSIEFDRGCAPFQASITTATDFREVTTLYSFLEEQGFTNDTTFTFHETGTFSIVQVVGIDSLNGELLVDKRDTLTIQVIEAQKPIVSISKCNNRQISLTSLDSFYDSIRVYFSATDSATLQTNESANHIFATTNTQNIVLKGLFDNAGEVCQDFFEEVTPLPSLQTPDLTSVLIKQTCRDLYSLIATIDNIEEGVIYRVNLEQQNTTTLYEGFLDSSFLAIRDIPFTEADFCVSLDVIDQCSNTSQAGNQICATPTSLSLSPFETLYSTYEGSAISINLDDVIGGAFEVERRVDDGAFSSIGTQEGSFQDPIRSLARRFSYRINYRDECGEILYTAETNPPLVSADEIDDNSYQIVFTPAVNSLDPPIETVYQVGSEGSFSAEPVPSNSFSINLDPNNGVPSQSLSSSSNYDQGLTLRSNTLLLRYEFVVYVPSAFTPNGDLINDELEFFGVPSANATVNIYSRWGQTIYTSNDLSIGWDGLVAGKPAPSGTYFYEIFFETTTGDKLRQRGKFVLLEK